MRESLHEQQASVLLIRRRRCANGLDRDGGLLNLAAAERSGSDWRFQLHRQCWYASGKMHGVSEALNF